MKTNSTSRLAFFIPRFVLCLVLCCVGLVPALTAPCKAVTKYPTVEAPVQTLGSWTVTGSMATARGNHAAITLSDGKVLVSGGANSSGYLRSADIYDPGLRIWTPTGSMLTDRGYHTAGQLPDGRVLVTGGISNSGLDLKSAEIYDPASGSWTSTANMSAIRAYHTATLLVDGRVLVTGGPSALSTTEIYDSASGTWSSTSSMSTGRFGHTATRLLDGRVLVTGGLVGGNTAEIYDPATATWSQAQHMSTTRSNHTATLLGDGTVLIAGGYTGSFTPLKSAEIFDPSLGTWSLTGDMKIGRWQQTATPLPESMVLVAGGYVGSSGDVAASAEIYDSILRTWTSAGKMAFGRGYHAATLVNNTEVLVSGGAASSGEALASAELYTPSTVTGGCLPPPAGLVSWWSGDKTAEDVQGINPGKLVGGASFKKGMVGPGFVFDGIDDGVRIPSSTSLSQTRITVAAWIYATGNQNTNRRILGKDDGFFIREESISLVVPNIAAGFVTLPSGIKIVAGITTIQLNTWYHIAMTHDGLKLRLYVNGILDGMVDAVGDTVPTSAPGVIGSDLNGNPFKGSIDEAQIYSRALTDAEILSIYQAGATGQCKPEIFVSSITPSYTISHSRFLVSTSVDIQDVNGVGTSGATVNVKVRFPSGSEPIFPVTTDESGNASFSFYTSETGLYKFKVIRVSHPIRTYDASLNIETSDTLMIP